MLPPVNRYRPAANPRGEDTRRRILDTALALFAANGFDGASTRDIAEHAGVNLPAIQYYFGSKEGLYRAVIALIGEHLAQTVAPVIERARRCLESDAPPRAQVINHLCELVDTIVAMFLDDTLPDRENRYIFVSRVEIEDTEALDPLHDVWREHIQFPAAKLVGRLMGRPPDDEKVLLRTLMILGQVKIFCSRAVMRGLGWQAIDEARVRTVQAMVNEHTRAICRALKGSA
ncbi:MAG TPA: CerR family C-terminal domain-containing protein [Rhodopila sp.]|uniref:CerR family C-terminal domain-containing protein n=1 Tax=Rhodopila sp. TaxID=2480087 RepID=UPI002BED06A3|nr:CerR family C-terminal domain-containing protein [Rhodopila sp.]HVY17882.1 CerR family C-terminal domain-containing protein [Rhodopila sp.]